MFSFPRFGKLKINSLVFVFFSKWDFRPPPSFWSSVLYSVKHRFEQFYSGLKNSVCVCVCVGGWVWVCTRAQSLNRVQLSATSRTVAHQAPLSMGFPRQVYSSVLPFTSPGDPPDPGIKHTSPALAGGFFTTEPLGRP